MEVLVSKSNKQLKTSFSLLIIALILPFGNAFIEGMGQTFNGMGDQLSGFVDNLYKTIDSWAEHIISHAKQEECHFICLYGKTPVENREYLHNPTGCGALGKQINDTDLPIKEMRECCDEHQMCYHKCGADKNSCDHKFQRCLLNKCKDTQKDPTHLKGCKTATKLLMMSFLTFGCKTYKDSQKRGCLCVGNDEL